MKFPQRSFAFIAIIAVMIAGCSEQPTPIGAAPTAVPIESSASTISATGEVVPAQWTTLSFAQAGTVVDLPIKEGDPVKVGDVIAQLDAVDLKANLAQKQAAVKTAEAELAQITAAPRADEVEAAKQAVAAAQARIAAATAQRDQLYSSVTPADITRAETQVYAAQIQADQLQDAMRKIINIGGPALAAGEPVGNQLKYAELQQAAAQSYLNDLLRGPTPNQLRVANARIWLTSAQAKAAQARLDLLQAGPLAQDVAIGQAKVDQAKADVAESLAQLNQTKIVAPFDGTIAKVLIDANQFVGPGQPIVQVADLTGLRIETTDLNESDVARINVGDQARVRFDALPGVEATGTITRLAPKAKEGTGVNFTAVIQLDQIPDAVRWGMTANADIVPTVSSNTTTQAAPRTAKVSANGKVVPAQKTTLSFALPGQVIDLRVDVGSTVKKGDVIARLDTSILDAEVAKAETAVKVAQANLDRIKTGPRAEQVAEAQSNLEAIKSIVEQSAASRDEVKDGPTQTEIDNARAAAQQAYITMVAARTKKDLLEQDKEHHKTTSKTVDDADKQYAIANRDYEAAQQRLNKLLSGADANTLRAAQADLGAASADYQAQQAQLNLLLAGARPEDVAVAESNLAQAQAALERTRATRQQAELIAPFDGTIGDVPIRQSQYVDAGAPIVLIADLSGLRIETTDLNEKDIADIAIGSKADVTFDALPGINIEGTVTQIAPKSTKSSGVNYAITINLTEVPERLRWGMTALVDMK